MPSLVNYAGIMFEKYCYEFYKIKQFFLVKKEYIFLRFPNRPNNLGELFLENHPKIGKFGFPTLNFLELH